jgi:hypothetical protein
MSICVATAVAILTGCQIACATTCKFLYTKRIQDELIIPALMKTFGRGYVYFDYDAPFIEAKGDKRLIRMSAVKEINGRRLLFEDSFVVILTACDPKVVRSYCTTLFQKNPCSGTN